MKTDQEPAAVSRQDSAPLRAFALSAIQEKNIELLYQVAKSNGSSLTVEEIMDWTSLDIGRDELESAWEKSKLLGTKYKLESGVVREKETPPALPNDRLDRAISNINYAKKFASFFTTERNLKLLCISGSTSYLSVSEEDDLDFFCITRNDSLWIFLAKALVRARLFRLRETGAPPLCFSYVLDESTAADLFQNSRQGLFARDAITAIVLRGQEYYRDLLKQNHWIASYFPKMYLAKLSDLSSQANAKSDQASASEHSSFFRKTVNFSLQYTLGTYIRAKSYLLNRRFAKKRDSNRVFRMKVSEGECVFESVDYLELRKKYAKLETAS